MSFKQTLGNRVFTFNTLKELLAKATPLRSGDVLAGVAAQSNTERVAAQYALADLPLKHFLNEFLIDYEKDEITRLIVDDFDSEAFKKISHFTVGQLRDWLMTDEANSQTINSLSRCLMPEMIAAVAKLMRNQDLIYVSSKIQVKTSFRNTLGLKGCFSSRLQPNHPTDDPIGIAAVILDGLMLGSGDALIGINPATDNIKAVGDIIRMLDGIINQNKIPTQSCVLSHITTVMKLMTENAPVDIVFQSIGGTQATNSSFGINLNMLHEAYDMALSLKRGTIGNNVMYFETGQGSSLSANAHHGIDQQTCEARAYAVAKKFNPLLVNTVVGFIGPEYLYDGKQIIRAGLEDHFCGKMLGLPMGVDVCYTNHAEADQDDMDVLLTLLANAGCNYIIGVPGADDIMLNYQSTSFHDALYIRKLLGLKPAPEFEKWLLAKVGEL